MFKKSTVGSQLPVQNNQYYLTVKSLKKLTNGDTVKLDQLICCMGKILKLAEKDEKDTSKLYIGSTDHHPISSTFIRYFRLDGKPEEMRVDKLLQVSFFIESSYAHLSKFLSSRHYPFLKIFFNLLGWLCKTSYGPW